MVGMNGQQSFADVGAATRRAPEVTRDAPAHRDAADTELQAARDITPKAGTWRRKVLDAVVAAGPYGLTDWELHQRLGGNLYTVAPRRKELVDDNWLKDSGLRRKTNNGKNAIVWVATSERRSA